MIPERKILSIEERITSKLEDETSLAWPAVQYLFSEVGPRNRRLDPRELQTGLHLLKVEARGPMEPLPGIYVKHGISTSDQVSKAMIIAVAKKAQLEAFRALINLDQPTSHLANEVQNTFEMFVESTAITTSHPDWLGADIVASVPAIRVDFAEKLRISILITSELRWLYPDDARVWQHLAHCAATGLAPVFLARKMSIAMFPLLKRLNGIGLQMHNFFVREVPESSALKAVSPGPLVLPLAGLSGHAALSLLKTQVDTLTPPNERVREAISLAETMGLAEQSGEGAKTLREWADIAPMSLPAPWKAQVTRYARWESSTTA